MAAGRATLRGVTASDKVIHYACIEPAFPGALPLLAIAPASTAEVGPRLAQDPWSYSKLPELEQVEPWSLLMDARKP